jgi:hypothetical protein
MAIILQSFSDPQSTIIRLFTYCACLPFSTSVLTGFVTDLMRFPDSGLLFLTIMDMVGSAFLHAVISFPFYKLFNAEGMWLTDKLFSRKMNPNHDNIKTRWQSFPIF